MADRIALGVMARAASDARGKTRLIQSLGISDGADLRRAILLDTLEAVQPVRLADRILLFTPDDARNEMASLGGAPAHILTQRGETLGERLRNGFDDIFALGYDGAGLIGSDLPTLPVGHVERGIEALMRHRDPVVLGPAEDGGYYFIGLRRPHPEIFQGIAWGTAGVLDETLTAAARTALSVTLIPSWYDVDSVLDLERALGAHRTMPGAARHLREWAVRWKI